MAITASFLANAGVLSVFGDNKDNSVTASRDAAGTILVNGGAVPVAGGTPTVANTSDIQMFGLGGNDSLSLDESNGALPRALLFGGAGNDTVFGGSGTDQLFGQSGNDVLLGRGGADLLFGGDGNDTLTGGDGDDQMFGEAGDDRMIWNPGDDSDLAEGGSGVDTLEVNGGNGAEEFAVVTNGARVRFDRIDPAPFTIDVGTTENIVINANGGDDKVDASALSATSAHLTIDGGAGNDTISGGQGADLLLGGDGNDVIDGNQGNDTVFMGAGDDVFTWAPGEGSDVVEGQAGFDALDFDGSNADENIDIAANGGRASFLRDVANIAMDLNDVERIQFNALGGADHIAVNNLSGTDVVEVDIDLAGVPGVDQGDGKQDTVTLAGTAGNDQVQVVGAGNDLAVVGLPAFVTISNTDGALDKLAINAGDGDDVVSASTLPAGTIQLAMDGGAGNDTLLGGNGADALIGGDGNDSVDGNRGDDVAFLGAGNDVFQWDPGDGSDVVEGQAGTDTLLFNGANVSENIDIAANGERVRFTRDIANITMDLNDVETIQFKALGGTDHIAVDDLSGTDVKLVAIDLAGAADPAAGDGQADSVSVDGTAGNDKINLSLAGTVLSVTGLPAQVTIDHAEVTDSLVISGFGGNDVIDAGAVPAGTPQLALDGGAGNDTITGGAGNDVLIGGDGDDSVAGGRGDDVALLGAGDDLFSWAPGEGNDVVEGQAGFDTLDFIGSNASEIIDVSANGERARLFRDVGNITMDLDDVERVQIKALGGADHISVNDLTGTDVTQVAIDLAGANSKAGELDTVTVNGTAGDDKIAVSLLGNQIVVNGLAAQVTIDHADKADLLVINGFGGNDVIDASGLAGGHIALQLNGGEGADTLIGSAGNDTVAGSRGDDIAFLGKGDDTFFWAPGDGDDVVEGQAGFDTLDFAGANISENIDISANGERARFTRNIANIVMDLNDVERIQFEALGGNDNIAVHDLTGTDVKQVAVDLAGAGTPAAADGLFDSVAVDGTAGNDKIALALSGTAVAVIGLSAQVTVDHFDRFDQLTVSGLVGNDIIDATKLTANTLQLVLDGGDGNDTVLGGLAAEALLGGNGDDSLAGGDGNDVLIGDNGDDTVNGGRGDDVALLGAGDDLFVWAPGEGSDVVEGQDGFDTLAFIGSSGNENFDLSANGERVRLFRDVGNITMDLNDVERIELKALGGADHITVNDLAGTDATQVAIDLAGTNGKAGDGETDVVTVNATAGADAIALSLLGNQIVVNGLAAQVTIDHADKSDLLVLNGGADNDVIDASGLAAGHIALQLNGGDGADILIGSAGNDTVVGGRGDDVGLLGAGNDVFTWAPGDGDDIVEGQAGFDTLDFIGANISENIDIAANGGRARFTRDVANIVMDLNDVERIQFKALGGFDHIAVHDLTGTDIKQVAIDLAGPANPASGDGQADTVSVDGTSGNDQINVALVDAAVAVTGTFATVTIDHADATDTLGVNGLGGDDFIDAGKLPANAMQLAVDGGAGNDTLIGSLGNDVLLGGDGNDSVHGGLGNDIALLGAGDDTFSWAPGDGSDIVESQDGFDTLDFTGANAAESIDIAANGGRVLLHRDIDGVAMDLNDVERIQLKALGGADHITVHDLTGTDVTQVTIDLAGTPNGTAGDGKVDVVTLDGIAGNDIINLSLVGNEIVLNGLAAQVTIDHADKSDILAIDGSAGFDFIDAHGLAAGHIGLQLFGGDGGDVLIGSAGNDTLEGGTGNDELDGGPGNDSFRYTSPLDGHDVIDAFDGNAAGGQDSLNLDALFDSLGVAAADRAGRVSIVDHGATVDVSIDLDGNAANGFELTAATLNTNDAITVGQDVLLGT